MSPEDMKKKNVPIKTIIYQLTRKQGYTITWIARDLGVSYHTIYYWLKGKRAQKRPPNRHLIKRLEGLLQ